MSQVCALAVENDAELNVRVDDWKITIEDGLNNDEEDRK
jgi:hypothetical protein